MDEPLQTLSEHFRPSLTISDLYRPYASFCDHLSTSDHHRKFPQLFTTCMRATSYVARYIPTISDPLSLKFRLSSYSDILPVSLQLSRRLLAQLCSLQSHDHLPSIAFVS